MSDQDKQLPKPPNTPFGRKRRFEQDASGDQLLSDRMGMAMAEGKIEEFMKAEIGENENAQKLAAMMMGLTGMPMGMPRRSAPAQPTAPQDAAPNPAPGPTPMSLSSEPPEDMLKAAEEGNIGDLAEILRREYEKRTGSTVAPMAQQPSAEEAPKAKEEASQGEPVFDRETLDQLLKIASDNNVSLDWLLNRAIRLYVRDYLSTGRM